MMADPLSLSVIHDSRSSQLGWRIRVVAVDAVSRSCPPLKTIILREGRPGKQIPVSRINRYRLPLDPLSEQDPDRGGSRSRWIEMAKRAAGLPRSLTEILEQAVTSGASDIHLEAGEDGVIVRQRLDGLLRDVSTIPEVGAKWIDQPCKDHGFDGYIGEAIAAGRTIENLVKRRA